MKSGMRKPLILFVAALFLLQACGGAPTEPRDFEFGRIDVYVRGTEGQPIDGVTVRLMRRNGGVEDEGGPTGSVGLPGYFFFLKTGGDYRVVITVPAGYTTDSLGTSRDVTFQRNVTRTVTFVLIRP